MKIIVKCNKSCKRERRVSFLINRSEISVMSYLIHLLSKIGKTRRRTKVKIDISVL